MRISDWSSDVCSSDLADLRVEALGLVFGIVQLGISVGDFTAADEQLEAVGDAWVVVAATRQRRDFERITGDERRLLQPDRKSVGEGKSVSVRVDLGGSGTIKKKNKKYAPGIRY